MTLAHTLTVKILFLTAITLVIPLFFVLVFVLSEYHKLAVLRRRCRDASAQLDPVRAPQAYSDAVTQYDTARSRFPTNLIALVFGFAPADPCKTESVASDRRPNEPGA